MSNSQKLGLFAGLIALVGFAVFMFAGETEVPDDAEHAEASGPDDATARREAPRPSPLETSRAPKASVTGRVLDSEGRGIGGARVCAAPREGRVIGRQEREPVCALSTSDGNYLIEGLHPAQHRVGAGAKGFIPASWANEDLRGDVKYWVALRPSEATTGIDIVLEAGGVEIRGMVKDISGGEVSGARIAVHVSWSTRATAPSTAISGEDGSFVTWGPEGEAWATAHAEGYASARTSGTVPGSTLEVFMTPESVISGRVVEAGTDKGVEGAEVGTGRDEKALTDAEGRFVLDALHPGEYTVVAKTDEGYGRSPAVVHVGLAQSAETTIELHPAFLAEGRVRFPNDEPCTQGNVRILDELNGHRESGEIGVDGHVALRALLPGSYEVSVECFEAVSKPAYDPLVIESESLQGLEWEVDIGRTLLARVMDESGEPVTGARLTLIRQLADDPSGQQAMNWAEASDAKGTIEMRGILPGSYRVWVNSDLPRPSEPIEHEVPAEGPVDELNVELESGGTVVGIVVGEDGEPVAGASVSARGEQWSGRTRTTDDGRFEFEHIATGEQRLVASMGWWDEMRAPGTDDDDVQGELVDVSSGDTSEVTLVVESRSGVIRGRVVDGTGGPVADAFVDSRRESDSAAAAAGAARRQARWGSWNRQPILTDQDGYFELDQLSEGSYTVIAHRRGGGEGVLENVEVGSRVEVAIADTGELGGRVTLAGGAIAERFQVRVQDKEQSIWRSAKPFKTGGDWLVQELPAGTYEVKVTAAQGSAELEGVALETGERKLDVNVELQPRITVTGTVLDIETRAPIAGLEVSVGGGGLRFNPGAGKGGDRDEVTDEAGRFTVKDAPSGRLRVSVMSRSLFDGDYSWGSFPRVIAAEPALQDLGEFYMVKRRTEDAGDRPGDLGFTLAERAPTDDAWDPPEPTVAVIRPSGPAADTGLEIGDVLVSVDGVQPEGTERASQLQSLLAVPPGTTVKIGVARGDTVSITAGEPL